MRYFTPNKAVALALGAAFLLSACTKTGGGATGEGGRVNSWTVPHVLTISDAGDINTLNPHLGQVAEVGYLGMMTMAWLIRWDAKNNPYPELATEVPTQANGGVSKDGLTITYHLRKGVKWSDGVPFDADDVVFSTGVVLNPANDEVGRLGWDQIAKVDEPDKYTVVYHMKKPYSPFVETFFSTAGGNPCILPKHLLAKYPNINNVPYNSLPVGIGPFKVERWDRSEQVVLVANPLYWRGRPKLDKVIFKIIPDRNTLLSQMQAHEIDMWFNAPGAYVARLTELTPYTVVRQPSYIYDHLDLNTHHPPFDNLVVRQALRLGVDRQALIDKIRHGVGILQEVTTPQSAPYYVNSIPVVAYDPAKANAILDKDGWKRGADGIREKGGLKLQINFATTSGAQDADQQIELIRANWKAIGVDINVRHYPPALMFAPLGQGGIVYGDKWDMIIFGWTADAVGDLSQIYGCQAFPPNAQNDLRWCNKRAQGAMDALYGHFDQAQRNQDVKIVQQELVGDAPTIVLELREDVFAYNKDLKNFQPNAVTSFDNMMDVDI
jgi:peptide/nickel transport system substrate-binding protein